MLACVTLPFVEFLFGKDKKNISECPQPRMLNVKHHLEKCKLWLKLKILYMYYKIQVSSGDLLVFDFLFVIMFYMLIYPVTRQA